jgi:hypothetical protein
MTKTAIPVEVQIVEGSALFHEGRTFFSGMTLRVSEPTPPRWKRPGGPSA